MAIERVVRGISFGNVSSSLKKYLLWHNRDGFRLKKWFYIRSSGTQETGVGAGRKKGFSGAVRGAELIPGSSLWPSARGLWVPSPSPFPFSFHLQRIRFSHTSSSQGALSIFVLGDRWSCVGLPHPHLRPLPLLLPGRRPIGAAPSAP